MKDHPADNPFGGAHAEEYNALRLAVERAAYNYGHRGDFAVYEWLEEVPQTSMVVELVNALHECGFSITPIENP